MLDFGLAAADREKPEVRVMLGAFGCAVEAASPARCLRAEDIAQAAGASLVLGAGKAAAAMAVAFNAAAEGRARGLVVTRYGHGLHAGEDAGAIDVIEAGHPHPDTASRDAARRMIELARSAGPVETLWFLVSGGGSALLAMPLPGLTLAAKRRIAERLMHAGADIREINVVRRHLSGIKGGRLAAAAHPTPVHTLAISDVPGDRLTDIASGPTVPDPSSQADALAILERYDCSAAAEVRALLTDPAHETPKPGDPSFADDDARIIATPRTALDAADAWLSSRGYEVTRLGDDLDAPARALGEAHGRLALETLRAGGRHALLSGGETRVVVAHPGARGGRNLEYLSALALTVGGSAGIHALAADTDGIDGNGDHAGGIVVPGIAARAGCESATLAAALSRNSTYDYFDRCKLLLRSGPTRTNVNDFRLILVDASTEE